MLHFLVLFPRAHCYVVGFGLPSGCLLISASQILAQTEDLRSASCAANDWAFIFLPLPWEHLYCVLTFPHLVTNLTPFCLI